MKRENQQGMISFSACVILCLMSIASLYVYKIAFWQNNSILILKQNLQMEDYVIGEAQIILKRFQQDNLFWQDSINKAQNSLTFEKAVIVDEQTIIEQNKIVKIKSYLMSTQEKDVYRLIVEAGTKDITSQVCVYLIKKADECIVQRWER